MSSRVTPCVPAESGPDRLTQALKTGHFKEALKLLLRDPANRRTLAKQALVAELQMRMGAAAEAQTLALRLLQQGDLDSASRVRCLLVLGTVCRDTGQIEQARQHYHSAFTLAEADQNLEQLCLAQLRLLSLQVAGDEISAVSATLPALRQNVQRAGDPFLAIALDICLAEAETRRGLFDLAKRRLNAANTLLRHTPNVFLEGNAAVAGLCISLFCSEWDDAVRLGLLALRCAKESGNFNTALAARLNLGQVLLSQGHLDEAERHLNEALVMCQRGGNNEIGVLDALAQVFLRRGDLVRCQDMLQRIDDVLEAHRLPNAYNRYWGIRTKLLLLRRLGRWDEAEQLVSQIGCEIPKPCDSSLHVCLALAKAEIFLTMGRVDEAYGIAVQAMGQFESMTLENQGQLERLLALHAARTSPQDAPTYFERAFRIFSAARTHSSTLDVLDEYSSFLSGWSPNKAVDDKKQGLESKNIVERVAALRRFSTNPRLLGTEAFWLLAEAGGPINIALVKGQTRGRQIVLSLPTDSSWLDQQAERPPVRIELSQDPMWTIHIAPRLNHDLPSFCVALMRLVKSLAEIGSSRGEPREQEALWPLPGDADVGGAVFVSQSMKQIVSNAKRIAATSIPVLITGETGSGKEVLARLIHRHSACSSGPFVAFNCTAVPGELLDSQLFGHRRGAFTGAHQDFSGLVRAANRGTLFLDEIGDLSRESQPKLLRFLESAEIYPLGDVHPVKVDVRIIAATHARLDRLIIDGLFREDLFYRLNTVRYQLPPLRERREEIPALVRHFLKTFAEEFRKGHVDISDEALDYLCLFSWPGNIRQLGNEIRRAVAMADVNGVLRPDHLSREIVGTPMPSDVNRSPISASELRIRLDQPLGAATERLERAMVEHALRVTDGRVDRAARLLGLSRKGLYLKRHRLDIQPTSRRVS
jgi:DNA-binding NtrC family response regulator/tetratricopeptide (TPR) repeat protein